MTTPAEYPGSSLTTLAERANEEHRQAEAAATVALTHARNAGEALNEAKARTPHGEWRAWVEDNFDGKPRTARVYQRIARNWKQLEDRQRAADLSIRGALRLLRGDEEEGDEEQQLDDAESDRVKPGVAYYLRFPEWVMGVDYGWIWPSHQEGFSWVTLVEDYTGPDSGSSVSTWNRPLRCDAIPTVLEAVRVPYQDAEWKTLGESEPTDYNRFLFRDRKHQVAEQIKRWKEPASKTDRAMRRRRAARKGYDY